MSELITTGVTFYEEGHRAGSPKGAILNLKGKRYGRLEVLEFAYIKNHQAYWKCRCDCGKIHIAEGHSMRTGNTVSCGCKKDEDFINFNTKHGYTLTDRRLYGIYIGMIHRCYNPNSTGYEHYGGRGIRICPEWYDPEHPEDKSKVGEFIKWAYANGYSDPEPGAGKSRSLTIDRIDNDGPYAPWNCRWEYPLAQMNNRHVSMYIYDGEEWLSFSQFARKYNMYGKSYITDKLKIGWNVHEIIYNAKHPELGLKSARGKAAHAKTRFDKDGFIRVIPHTPGARIVTADEYHDIMRKERRG